jgi:uncharacterized protein (UPF0548 family)
MELMSARRAASDPVDAAAWEGHAANTSRDAIAGGGYLHDYYEGLVAGTLEAALERLFTYDIFPPRRMRARVCAPEGVVVVGATIVQRVFMGPVALETAVKVLELEQSPRRGFFAYATTAGHPERGIASFEVLSEASGIKFVAQAWSRPGNAAAVIGRPISRWLQKLFTAEAVEYFCADAPARDSVRRQAAGSGSPRA